MNGPKFGKLGLVVCKFVRFSNAAIFMFSAIPSTDSLEANVFARNSAKLEVYHRQPKQQLSEIIRVYMGIFTTALRNKELRQILKKKKKKPHLTSTVHCLLSDRLLRSCLIDRAQQLEKLS